jgi:class 3 adenylate cyclase
MAVLFADISDSAYFYETFGDDRARQIVLNCLDVLEAVVTERGGRVVDRIGDELMCTFPSADTTAEAAVELQEKVHKARLSDRLPANVSFRVGFHFGPVILDGDNIFGETVYIAKRVSRLAKGGQILTTGETLDALETKSDNSISTRSPGVIRWGPLQVQKRCPLKSPRAYSTCNTKIARSLSAEIYRPSR